MNKNDIISFFFIIISQNLSYKSEHFLYQIYYAKQVINKRFQETGTTHWLELGYTLFSTLLPH